MYPDCWKEYCDFLRGKNKDKFYAAGWSIAKANRFSARYRMAVSFEAAIFSNEISKKTATSFSHVLATVLSQMALEAAIVLNKKDIGTYKMTCQECAELFKSSKMNTTLINTLMSNIKKYNPDDSKKSTIEEGLDNLVSGNSSDVWCIARAIRNSFAHGDMTSHGAGVAQCKIMRKFFIKLKDVLINHCNLEMAFGLKQCKINYLK